jgi:hypothetical protein
LAAAWLPPSGAVDEVEIREGIAVKSKAQTPDANVLCITLPGAGEVLEGDPERSVTFESTAPAGAGLRRGGPVGC